ncbi:MAG TPA: hypothetical protein PKE04_09780, partial [Clostridia bacterium]|nr:hypothetical protein [Clostridia bacterium]
MDYLDSVPEFLSGETAAWLDRAVPAQEAWSDMEESIESALQNMDAFLDEHKEFLDEYLAYRSSPDFD